MNKLISMLCIAALLLTTTGCGRTSESSVEQLLGEELSGEITVSCYDTMMYKASLETAAKSFEEKNPGTKINIETYSPMPEIKTSESNGSSMAVVAIKEDSQDDTEYISKINTELMSGEGADILAMDILPYYKYADSGQLEDLQKYMDADDSFQLEEYRKNIIEALKYNGGQYVMPMDYIFDYIAYDSSLFTEEEQQNFVNDYTFTYDQLIKSAEGPFQRANAETTTPKRMFGASAFSSMQPGMFNEMMQLDIGTFLDMESRTANLTDGRFTELLESLRAYDQNGYFLPSTDSSKSRELSIENFAKQREEQLFYKLKSHFSLLTEALEKAGATKVMVSIGSMSNGNEDHDKALGLLNNENQEVPFTYTQAYGINANSDNKALAWAFLKYLMSEEMQASVDVGRFGLPVNNAARLEKAKMDITGVSFQKGMLAAAQSQNGKQDAASNQDKEQNQNVESTELTKSQQAALDQYVKTIEDFSDLLNYCPIQDETVKRMISEEVAHYFDGSKTAEEVAENLENKIELYLNE